VWGGSFVATRVVLHPMAPGDVALTPVILAASRFSLAAAFFVVPLIRAFASGRLGRTHLLKMAVLGQTAISIYFWLQNVGVAKTNAGISSILVVGLSPLAAAVVGRAIGSETLGAVKLGALVLGFVGVLVIGVQAQGATLSLDPGFLVGSVCLIANAVGWALNSTMAKQWMQDAALSPPLITGGSIVFGALGLVLISLIGPAAQQWTDVLRLDPARWVALLYLALVCSIGGFVLYNFALTKVEATQATFYGYVEPVVAVSLGVALLGERLNGPTVAGALMIGCAALMIGRATGAEGRGRPAPASPAR
jgi:drug/metabolite transporter (DMT)-like permease